MDSRHHSKADVQDDTFVLQLARRGKLSELAQCSKVRKKFREITFYSMAKNNVFLKKFRTERLRRGQRSDENISKNVDFSIEVIVQPPKHTYILNCIFFQF